MNILIFMHKNKKNIIFMMISLSLLLVTNITKSRSVLRKSYKRKPTIQVKWTNKHTANYKEIETANSKEKNPTLRKKYFIRSTQLEINPIFKTFNNDFFYDHILPENIDYRYEKNTHTTKKQLEHKLKNLFTQIDKKERRYTDFDILKDNDFNRRKKSGLLILKFKDYPFVVKIFMENPKNFVRPYSKGICPIFFFNMGGGINRHLLGFTRVKNLQNMQEILNNSPKWKTEIEMPRKWYWVPKESKNLEITGTNFIPKKTIKTIIPGTYCVIADAIKLKNTTFSIFDRHAREKCMSLCNSLEICIDPHIDNFLLEKNSNKIVIIDTEHFPSIVGLKEGEHFDNYFSWYFKLTKKCISDMYFKTKKERFKKT